MIKCTALFQLTTNVTGDSSGGPHIGGWSETWWSDDGFAPTVAAFNNLCRRRAPLLPASAVIVGQRYQTLGGGSAAQANRYPGRAASTNDVPQMALLCTGVVGDSPNVRRFTLRGFPDVWVREGELLPENPFPALWNAFKDAVESGPFGFRGRSLTNPSVRVASIIAGALVLEANLAMIVGDYVQIRNAVDQFRGDVSGIYQILTRTDDQHYTLRGWPAGSEVTLSGFARKHEIGFKGTNLVLAYNRVVVRKVGRPFEQYRGRGRRRR